MTPETRRKMNMAEAPFAIIFYGSKRAKSFANRGELRDRAKQMHLQKQFRRRGFTGGWDAAKKKEMENPEFVGQARKLLESELGSWEACVQMLQEQLMR